MAGVGDQIEFVDDEPVFVVQEEWVPPEEPAAAAAVQPNTEEVATTTNISLAFGDTFENPGVARETFTIHIYRVPKEVLLKQMTLFGEWAGDGKPISFNTGLLAGVKNSFEIKLHRDLSQVRMQYPKALHKDDTGSDLEISGVKMSFLQDGVLIRTMDMSMAEVSHFFYVDGLDDTNWPETVNELQFDITISKYTAVKLVTLKELATALPDSKTTWSLDLGKYYLSREFSDVTIKCGSEAYPAHLNILSLNSPVFAKMFTHDTKEAQEKRVEIEGADPKAVLEMLRFFYTGKVEDLDKFGIKLYELADRYLVDKLKAFCTNTLFNHINMDNAVEVYCFGRKHENHLLTDMAKRVIMRNKKACFKDADDLQAFTAAAPDHFAKEIFQCLIGQ